MQEVGDGHPVFFIRGAAVAGQLVARLDGVRSILVDRRGCGLSSHSAERHALFEASIVTDPDTVARDPLLERTRAKFEAMIAKADADAG